MSDYKISVIIPTYNAENYLEKCIDSLINQTFGFENLEVLLIDDKSTDSTPQIINELSAEYPNIKPIFNEKNSGSPSLPRNIGVENATSQYVMYMDNDDFYYPDMCETMYSAITKENVDVVSCRLIFNKDEKEEIKEVKFLDKLEPIVKLNNVYDLPEIMTSSHPGFIWNKIFKRELLMKYEVKFPDNALYEDVYFMSQVYLHANGILLLNDYWGYSYVLRTKGEHKSTSESFTEKNLLKQFNGLEKIIELLEKEKVDFPKLECEMIAGWTKLFILTNPTDDLKKKLLTEARPIYKNYKLFIRLTDIPLLINMALNIFIKIFSLNISLAIWITNTINFFIKK